MDSLTKEGRDDTILYLQGKVFRSESGIKHKEFLRSFNVLVNRIVEKKLQLVAPNFLMYFYKETNSVRMFNKQIFRAYDFGSYVCQAAMARFRFETMLSASPRLFRNLIPDEFLRNVKPLENVHFSPVRGPAVQLKGI